jgi:hypothetical protein
VHAELVADLLEEGLEADGVIARQRAEQQRIERVGRDVLAERMQRVADAVPAARRRERLFARGRHVGGELRRARAHVVQHPRMDVVGLGPLQPLAVRGLQVQVHHAIDQRAGHLFRQRRVLRAVARADDDGAGRQPVLADALVQDQAVERLLDLLAGDVELVDEQHELALAHDHRGRIEAAHVAVDLRDADQVLRRQLRAEQRHALEPEIAREGLHQRTLADAWRAPDEHGAGGGNVEQEFVDLANRKRDLGLHGETSKERLTSRRDDAASNDNAPRVRSVDLKVNFLYCPVLGPRAHRAVVAEPRVLPGRRRHARRPEGRRDQRDRFQRALRRRHRPLRHGDQPDGAGRRVGQNRRHTSEAAPCAC